MDAKEKAFLVGIQRKGQTRFDMESSLAELGRLLDTAGAVVGGQCHQSILSPHPKTFIGSGKVEEILQCLNRDHFDAVAIDDELTPAQNRNLETEWGVKVLDRTAVILDIFSKRARTKEGRLQVELAQLEYLGPRLRGLWQHLGKQTGGTGMRGPGETQLEVDRRRLKDKISRIREQIDEVRKHRAVQRFKRMSVPIPLISVIGYTNAGKSTLLRSLTKAEVLVEDKLFATLDPMVRRLKLPSGRQVLLADTVGFIRRLPHPLVEAFKATFEEISHSTILVHLIDCMDPEAYQHAETVEKVLQELNLHHKPRMVVLNKKMEGEGQFAHPEALTISALKGDGFDRFLNSIDDLLRRDFVKVHLVIPHNRGDLLPILYQVGTVELVDYSNSGIHIDCELPQKYAEKYRIFQG